MLEFWENIWNLLKGRNDDPRLISWSRIVSRSVVRIYNFQCTKPDFWELLGSITLHQSWYAKFYSISELISELLMYVCMYSRFHTLRIPYCIINFDIFLIPELDLKVQYIFYISRAKRSTIRLDVDIGWFLRAFGFDLETHKV